MHCHHQNHDLHDIFLVSIRLVNFQKVSVSFQKTFQKLGSFQQQSFRKVSENFGNIQNIENLMQSWKKSWLIYQLMLFSTTSRLNIKILQYFLCFQYFQCQLPTLIFSNNLAGSFEPKIFQKNFQYFQYFQKVSGKFPESFRKLSTV